MVDDDPGQAASATEQAHRYSGAVGIGPPADAWQIDYDHAICVTYCLHPGQRRLGVRCPACYGQVHIRPIGGAGIEPGKTRAERLAAWVGGWVGAFLDAMMFPFRVGRAHQEAMIRDILSEALAAGLQVDELSDILTVLEGIESELRGLRDDTSRGAA